MNALNSSDLPSLDAATKWNWRTIWQRLRRDLRHDPALAYIAYLPVMAIYYGIVVKTWWEMRHFRRALKQAQAILDACDKTGSWSSGATVSDEPPTSINNPAFIPDCSPGGAPEL